MGGGSEAVAVGEVLDRYRLDRLLGAGATSQVFLATHIQLERRVAIKVLAPRLLMSPDSVQRMLQEARLVNAVRHPNIIEVFDFIESQSPLRVALVMEYIEGPSLRALSDFRLAFEQALGVGLQLCAAVQAAHAAGVIHRDLKPDNLLFTRDPRTEPPTRIPRLKIIDFGIAKLTGSSGKTVTGKMVGTPAYMAPEQIAGQPPASPATDVFAVGELLFDLLAGHPAYQQTGSQDVVRAKLRGQKPDLALPEVEHRKILEPLIERCLAREPAERPTLAELRAELQAIAPWPEVARGASARPSVNPLGDLSTRPWIDALEVQPSPAPTHVGRGLHSRADEDIPTISTFDRVEDGGPKAGAPGFAAAVPPIPPTEIAPAPKRNARPSIPLADTIPTTHVREIEESSTLISTLDPAAQRAVENARTPISQSALADPVEPWIQAQQAPTALSEPTHIPSQRKEDSSIARAKTAADLEALTPEATPQQGSDRTLAIVFVILLLITFGLTAVLLLRQ